MSRDIAVMKYVELPYGEPQRPTQAYYGDAGWDLYTSRAIKIPPKAFREVQVDIAAEFPDRTWGLILGRSSASRKHKLKVEPAVIDGGYRGSLHVGVRNTSWRWIKVEVGTRLAQLILLELIPMVWVPVAELSPSERGTGGFGSSGR